MAFFGAYMKIYWTKQKSDSRELASAAHRLYRGVPGSLCYNQNGRPYFQDSDIKISISHSGDIWLCVLGEYEAGIDIERVADRDYIKIAQRFFTEAESLFVIRNGADGFFRLWARKEAYVKYTGLGISFGLGSFSLSDGNALADSYNDVIFKEIDFGKDFKCAVCATKEAFDWTQITTEEMHI